MKLYCPECKATYEDMSLMTCPRDEARLFVLDQGVDDPLIGELIDQRFKIESKLGQGGMGAVYNAVQLSVGRRVAVKVLKRELVDKEIALERFYRESKLTSELSHPNIVKLIDFGQDRDRDLLYLVMELVQGVDMSDLMAQGRMRINVALDIVYQVCGALTEPHAQGIIHRDLKPDNLLLVPISDGTLQVKVLDFGIARALETTTQITATGMVCGTPAYMAPEQAQNQELGPQTDLYALGVMLYEMLTGSPPFDGQNSLQIMLQHIQAAPKPLAAYFPPGALPDEVQALTRDLLAKTTRARPSSALEVRATIEKIQRLYQLEPVRLDPSVDRDKMFDHLILSRLPGAEPHTAPGYTKALRRETAMERARGASYSTDEREEIGLADTSLHLSEPELVTVQANEVALAHELDRDALQRAPHSPQPSPLPLHTPRLSPGPQLPPPSPPRHGSTDTRDSAALKASTTSMQYVAVGIFALIVLAVGVLLAVLFVSTGGEDTEIAAPPHTPVATTAPTPKTSPHPPRADIRPKGAFAPTTETRPDPAPQTEDKPAAEATAREETQKEIVKAAPMPQKSVKREDTTKKNTKAPAPKESPEPAEKKPRVDSPPPSAQDTKKPQAPERVSKPEEKAQEEAPNTPPKKSGFGNLFDNSKRDSKP